MLMMAFLFQLFSALLYTNCHNYVPNQKGRAKRFKSFSLKRNVILTTNRPKKRNKRNKP